jgi:DNA-binding PadR family transcriptional regulator
MRRSVHWFWPRAESVIYAEAKKLVGAGLATAREEPVREGARRTRTVYRITARGRRALASWLAQEPEVLQVQDEALLRVHLARFGTVDDLVRAAAWLHRAAEEILVDADAVAEEFVAGRHLFQEELAPRALIFDALVAQARTMQEWADDVRRRTADWDEVHGDEQARRDATDRMQTYLETRKSQVSTASLG